MDIQLRPLNVDRALIAKRLPGLNLRAAYQLVSDSDLFGGISGALVDGDRILLLSDRSLLFEGRIVEDSQGTISDLTDWRVRQLRDRGTEVDSESLAWTANGAIAVAIEDEHRIRCLGYETTSGELEPCDVVHFRLDRDANSGIEALALMPNGRLLALIEGRASGKTTVPAMQLSPTKFEVLAYHPFSGFSPTGADRLGDRLYILERRLSLLGGWEARIVVIDTQDLDRYDVDLNGQELGRLGVGMEVDNFEAIAARVGADGTDELLIFSDDNFLPLQRTLFYQFSAKKPAHDR